MRSLTLSPMILPAAVVATALVAAATVWALSALAAPSDFKARIAAVDLQADAVARPQGRSPTRASRFPAGAVCSGPLVRASGSVRRSLAAKAATAGLTVSTLNVTPGASGSGPGVGAVDVVVEAAGAYPQILAFLNGLAVSRPVILADSVDIQPAGSSVSLKLSGQAYCWTSAPR